MSALREIWRHETGYLLRQRATWVYAVVLPSIAFLAMSVFVHNARGELFNTPLAIAGAMMVTGMLGLLVTSALTGEVATRDARSGMEPLLHTAPITTVAYLGGRFLAGAATHALLLSSVPAAVFVATVVQTGMQAGPLRPAAYLNGWLFVALPNSLVATALLFACAVMTRTAVASHVGALILFLLSIVCEGVLGAAFGHWELAGLLDPFGFVVVRTFVRAWTNVQKDTMLVSLEGMLLWNRLLWLTVAAGALWFTHRRFRFGPVHSRRRKKHATVVAPAGIMRGPYHDGPVYATCCAFGPATRVWQMLAIARRSFISIARSRAGLVLAFPALFILVLGPGLLRFMGTPVLPTTAQIIQLFVNSSDVFLAVVAPTLIVVYAGELIWREREVGFADIMDATPVPAWVLLSGRLLGLAFVLTLLQLVIAAAGVILQTTLAQTPIELGLYLRVLFGVELTGYLLFAVLAFTAHTIIDHKHLGHVVVLLAYAFTVFATELGVENPLLVYGAEPAWTYTDMRGFGPAVVPLLWLRAYWLGFALLLAIATRLLWVRGRDIGLADRMRLARARLSGPILSAAACGLVTILIAGGVIAWNRSVSSDSVSTSSWQARAAEYERRYSRYAGLPQPRLTRVVLNIEIHPRRGDVEIRGSYFLANSSGVPIDSIHLSSSSQVAIDREQFDRPSLPVHLDEELGYRIHALDQPLQPGDSLRLDFVVAHRARGFGMSAGDYVVAMNGTWFDPQVEGWVPAIGYQPGRELVDRRGAYDLGPRARLPAPQEAATQLVPVGKQHIMFEAIVGTDDDQIGVAPGALRRSWTENGRRYFEYATDWPIRNEYVIASAQYAVHESRWNDVAIRILHHPAHAWNVDRMARAAGASLEHLSHLFGSYPHGDIRLVEQPAAGTSLHAAPVNISYREGFALLDPASHPRGLDFPFAVVAHEIAHQWWGNLLTPANVEGAPLLTESVAWYAAMEVVEASLGADQLQELLRAMRQAYLRPQALGAAPLLRASDWFVAYRRGPFAMYALREYIGAEPINTALRRMLDGYARSPQDDSGVTPPLPSSLDLYRELRATTPDSLHGLLADLFERNTFWQLEARAVSIERAAGGRWRVFLDVLARKVVIDESGSEIEQPMDDFIEIGVFSAERNADPLHLQLHRIRSGSQRITITVDAAPASAGIDPRNLLIDLNVDDNITGIQRQGSSHPLTPS